MESEADFLNVDEMHALPQFDPVFVTEDDLQDLSTFTGLSRTQCLNRLRSYSQQELADAWMHHNPTTPEQMLDFYRSTDLYVWELMQWHASVSRRPYWHGLETLVERFRPDDGYGLVLDFGCGVGTDAIYLARRGYDVTCMDVDGPAFRFAQHRFRRRRLPASFRTSDGVVPQPGGPYDIIVCFDVFEHLPHPLEAARRLVGSLRADGVMAQTGGFDDAGHHPCHLPDGVQQYSGLRWHIYLSGLGLRSAGGVLYQRVSGIAAQVQRARYAIWRATGLWVSHVPR